MQVKFTQNMEKKLESAIISCQKGQLEQFAVLYDAYVKKIYDFLYFRLRHKETAEDLTSAVFMKALEKIQSYNQEKSAFNTWLYTIARNTLFDHFRSHKDQSPIDEALEHSSNQNIVKEVGLKMEVEKVQQLLNKLDSEQRDLVIMRVWDGLSFKEIAEILGKSEAASKMQFGRTLKLLQAQAPLALLCLLMLKPTI